MKCLTYEFWYHPWAEKVGNELGATPADTFHEATGISMDEFLLAGDLITSVLRTGHAHYDLAALREHGVSDQVVQYIRRNMVRDLNEFRAMSQRDRERGDVRAQRYTFTQFPFLGLGGEKILALRAQWGMDRFFGNAPEFDVQQGFHEQGRAATTTPPDPTPPTANSPQPSSPYSGPRPTNPKPHSDWTTKRVPLTSPDASDSPLSREGARHRTKVRSVQCGRGHLAFSQPSQDHR
jgi:hypothetical protein